VDAKCQAAAKVESKAQADKMNFRPPSEEALAAAASVVPGKSREESLRHNLLLIERAMEIVAAMEPSKLAPLSKRHSELLAELEGLNGSAKQEDPLDAFLSGGDSNVVGFPTPTDRKVS
jgi:hypothetical protein